jgi:hypothetical protein
VQDGSQSGAGEGLSSSEYMTESEDQNELVDARVGLDVDMENVATVNQMPDEQDNLAAPGQDLNVAPEGDGSPNGNTNAEMHFSPPYMDIEPSALESGIERERQNTNIGD